MCTTLLDEEQKRRTLIQQPYLSKTFQVWWLPARLLCSWRPAQRREGGGEEGGGGGGRGGEGQDGMGGGRAGNTGITGSRLEQQTAPEVGGHRAAAHGSRSWGTWGKRADRERLSYTQTHSRGKQLAAWLSMSCDLFEVYQTPIKTESSLGDRFFKQNPHVYTIIYEVITNDHEIMINKRFFCCFVMPVQWRIFQHVHESLLSFTIRH